MAGNAAHVPEHLRLEGIRSNSWVDESVLIDEPIEAVIQKLRPDIVVKGREHEQGVNAELEVLKSYGGKLIFSSGESIFSSVDLIRREFESLSPGTITLPSKFMDRHGLSVLKLAERLKGMSELKVCVIGDLIVDEYITCEPLGMSQEDPTIVVTPVDSALFLGGAGIVAAHAASLGAKVQYFGVTGDDPAKLFALERLVAVGVITNIVVDGDRPTTLKQRYRSHGKSLLRVSHLRQQAISLAHQYKILVQLEKAMEGASLLVFSDFNYGCLPQLLVDRIIAIAQKNKVMLAADSQSSSQVGNIGRFKGMHLITPTEREARISTRNQEGSLIVLAEQLRIQASAKYILLKMAGEGLLVHADGLGRNSLQTDRIPALNAAPKDVAGAGDSLLIVSAMALAGGANIWEAACLGSLAAAVQIGRVGNTPLSIDELLSELK